MRSAFARVSRRPDLQRADIKGFSKDIPILALTSRCRATCRCTLVESPGRAYIVGRETTERSPCPKHHRRLHRRKPAFARRKSVRKKGMQPGNNTKPRVAPFGKRPSGCGPCGSPRRPRKRWVKFPPSRVSGDPSKLRFPSPVPTAAATWTEATSTSAFRRFHRPSGSRSADSA